MSHFTEILKNIYQVNIAIHRQKFYRIDADPCKRCWFAAWRLFKTVYEKIETNKVVIAVILQTSAVNNDGLMKIALIKWILNGMAMHIHEIK